MWPGPSSRRVSRALLGVIVLSAKIDTVKGKMFCYINDLRKCRVLFFLCRKSLVALEFSHLGVSICTESAFTPDSGRSNSIVYSSPNFGGLTVNLIYAFGEQPGSTGQNKWGGNVTYFSGAFAATAAFQQVKCNIVPGDVTAPPPALAGFDKQTAAQLGLSYDFGVAKVFGQAQYIRTAVNGAQGDIRRADGQIGASVPLGAGNVLASYAYANTRNDTAAIGRHTAAIAYGYNLSKRTDLYAAYFYDRVTGQSHAETFGAGMRHQF